MRAFIQLAVLLTSALAHPLFPRAPVLPSQDPFYTQPANISLYQPGQVIATRNVPPTLGGFTGLTTEPIKEFLEILYRTNDSLNQPAAAVASVLVPSNANASTLLVYENAYDSANNDCSPSYGLQTGANSSAIADIAFISAALNKGYYVVTSDYEGLKAEFTAGIQAGHAVLDSVRATFSLAPRIGLSSSAKYALWGYSGGALASEWAAELQPSYAPELHFEGVALGGLTPNITSVLETINQTPFAGLAFSGITGLVRAIPAAAQLFNEQVLGSKRAEFESIAAGCLTTATINGAGKNLYDYFIAGHQAIYDPRFQNTAIVNGQMGRHGVPTSPIFAYKAVGDEISKVADTDALVQTLCSKGAVIEYHRDSFGEHVTEAITGSVSAFSWISDRLDGKPVSNKGCVTEEVFVSSIGPGAPAAFTIEIISLLESLLGSPLPLGPINGASAKSNEIMNKTS